MRWILALATLALLSGCIRAPAEEPVTDPLPPAPEPEPTYAVAMLGTFDVTAAAEPQEFTVAIPEGARNVTASGEYLQASMLSLDVAVDGCGAGTYDTVVVAGFVGSFADIPVCREATPGDAEVTITVDGTYAGSVTLAAEVPAPPAASQSQGSPAAALERKTQNYPEGT